jgi:hypothetical protein
MESAGAGGAGSLEGSKGAAFGGDEESGRGVAEVAGVGFVEALEESEGLGWTAVEALGGEIEQPGSRVLPDMAGIEAVDAAVAEAFGTEEAGGETAPAAGGVVKAGVEVAQGSGFLSGEGALKSGVNAGVAYVDHGGRKRGADYEPRLAGYSGGEVLCEALRGCRQIVSIVPVEEGSLKQVRRAEVGGTTDTGVVSSRA